MDDVTKTSHTAERDGDAAGEARAGIVLVFAGGRPMLVPQALDDGTPIGRNDFAGAVNDDDRASRQHFAVERTSDGFRVVDAGSRNGTWVDGVRASGAVAARAGSIVRFGKSLALLVADIRPYAAPRPMVEDGIVAGPTLRAAWDAIARAVSTSEHLLVLGESGSGKEVAARVFHQATGRDGPLVAVNCAAIPAGVAERLLFGARRGAFSGADKDVIGYLQSAEGGTLFLDEVAELELDVQAKLLRSLEAREVLPLGATRPIRTDLRLCTATHTSLRDLAAAGRFREDLYYRIGRPEVALPPLRERPEEIPWLVAEEVKQLGVRAEFVEACILRRWPGNVRELRLEVRQALTKAAADKRDELRANDLDDRAGRAIDAAAAPLVVRRRGAAPGDDDIRRALEVAQGNVTQAARELGMHRTQLRRWIERQRRP